MKKILSAKKIISSILAAAILSLGFSLYERESRAQVAPAIFVVITVGVAGIVLIGIYHNIDAVKMRWVVLQTRMEYYDDWRSVATNHVPVGPRPSIAQTFPAFSAEANAGKAYYRVILIDPPSPQFRVQHIPGSPFQPVIY